MPYSIKSNDSRCPKGKPFSVVNSDTNDLRGCHVSKESAREQQKALYANVPDADRSEEPPRDPVAEYPVSFSKSITVAW